MVDSPSRYNQFVRDLRKNRPNKRGEGTCESPSASSPSATDTHGFVSDQTADGNSSDTPPTVSLPSSDRG